MKTATTTTTTTSSKYKTSRCKVYTPKKGQNFLSFLSTYKDRQEAQKPQQKQQ